MMRNLFTPGSGADDRGARIYDALNRFNATLEALASKVEARGVAKFSEVVARNPTLIANILQDMDGLQSGLNNLNQTLARLPGTGIVAQAALGAQAQQNATNICAALTRLDQNLQRMKALMGR